MIVLRFGAPNTVSPLPERLKLTLREMRAGHVLRATTGEHGLIVWLDSAAPVAFILEPGDLACLIGRDLVEEDEAKATDRTSVYRLTAAGREAW